jgi:hypothetical protein
MRCVEGSVVARFTRDMMREMSADDEGRMVERIDVE